MSLVRIAACLARLLAGAVLLAGACKQDVVSQDRLCTPGNYVFCRCKDLSQGTKLCHGDGMGFDACTACQPGDEVPPTPDALDASTPDTPPDPDASTSDAADDATGTATKPTPGELLITEILYDPSGTEPDEEWIEVYNAATGPRRLGGLSLKDGANHTVQIPATSSLVLDAGQYALLVRDTTAATAAKVPSRAIVLEYGAGVSVSQGILLANGTSGAVWLMDGTTTIAGTQYGGWFSQSSPGGKSVQLRTLSLAASGQQASWCLSANAWATGSDRGTPGAANDCP